MKNLKQSLIIVSIALLFAACNTSQTAFKKGNYYDATLKAVKQLRNNPESKNALEVIQKSYPMALDYERQQIDQIGMSNHPDKYLNIVEIYTRLNNLADEISRCPAALEILKPVVYFHSQLKRAEGLAVKEQFDAAQRLMTTGNYLDARLALQRLEWIKEKDPDLKDLNELISQARDLATLKTVVILKPELHENYDINSNVFYLRVFDFLDKTIENEFIRFYEPRMAEKINLQAHEVLTIQFLEFQIGTLAEREKEIQYQSDSLVTGTYTDNKGIEHDAFGIVKAKVTSYESELPAKALLELKIMDENTNEVIASQKFSSDYIWKNEWATFNGDERAIPDYMFKLTKRKQMMPPAPQEMFLLLSDPLYNNAIQFLRSYYRKK